MIDSAGIVLAGGRSTRMGRDKALLPLGNASMIKIVVNRLREILKEVLVVSTPGRSYSRLAARMIYDVIPNQSSLGGLYSGLLQSPAERNFVCACDMPLVQPALIEYLLQQSAEVDAVIPSAAGQHEPLCAVYTKNCLPHIHRQILAKDLRMTSWLQHVKTSIVMEAELRLVDPHLWSFLNLNTEADYRKLLDLIV